MSPQENWPGAGSEIPQDLLEARTRGAGQLPPTFRPVGSPDAVQRYVFDPASVHYSSAYRAGDPTFAAPEIEPAWHAARLQALHHVLAAIAGSPWADSLVLRGSMTMSLWFPGQAREPRDLDFVVVPHSWGIHDPRTSAMLADIARAAQEYADRYAGQHDDRLTIAGDRAVLGDIWTYDRVPGRRMVLPWASPGLPGGDVQLDFVFNEGLPQEPQALVLPGGATVPAASPALSLAWKLLWLISDPHPQGKDLFDAVLLAEREPPPRSLLTTVFRAAGDHDTWLPNPEIGLDDVAQAANTCEVHHLITEYPSLASSSTDLAGRLIAALRPTFAEDLP